MTQSDPLLSSIIVAHTDGLPSAYSYHVDIHHHQRRGFQKHPKTIPIIKKNKWTVTKIQKDQGNGVLEAWQCRASVVPKHVDHDASLWCGNFELFKRSPNERGTTNLEYELETSNKKNHSFLIPFLILWSVSPFWDYLSFGRAQRTHNSPAKTPDATSEHLRMRVPGPAFWGVTCQRDEVSQRKSSTVNGRTWRPSTEQFFETGIYEFNVHWKGISWWVLNFPRHFCPGRLHLFKVAGNTKVESLTQFLPEGSTIATGPRLSKPLQFEHPNDNDRPDRHVIQGFFRWVQMVWVCSWLDTSSNILES